MSTNPAKRSEARRIVSSWLVLLGPPLVWLLQFQVRYALAGAQPGSRGHGIDVATGLTALAAIAALGVLAWRRYQVWRPGDSVADSVAGRERFMALLGLLVAGLFWLLTLAQLLANLFLRPGPT